MTNQLLEKLDPTPLVTTLMEKSSTGKLKWQATARAQDFIASVGGNTTLKIALTTIEQVDLYGQMEAVNVPALLLLDEKGKTLWEIESSQVKGGLWPLYRLAQRIGNKLDERMAALIEVLQKL